MTSFLSSVFLGTESKHNIAGIKIVFDDRLKEVVDLELEEKNWISDLAHDCLIKAFPLVTFRYMHCFIYGMGCLFANKIMGNQSKELHIFTDSLFSKVVPQDDKEGFSSVLLKISATVQMIFEVFLFIGAKVLVNSITKPVAVVIAGSAIFWVVDRVHKRLDIDIGLNPFPDYTWKNKTAILATYALSLFAAYKMI